MSRGCSFGRSWVAILGCQMLFVYNIEIIYGAKLACMIP